MAVAVTRTKLSLVVAVCILAAPLVGETQPARKVYRIGYMSTQSPSAEAAHLDAFRQALRDRGYVDGQNVRIEYRFAEGKSDRLAGFAAELVRLNVDVIVTGGSPGTRAALQATRTVPLVMTVVGDPIEAGFVTSLARPGGNVTGLTQMSPQLSGKRLELLKEAIPSVSRVAVFVDAVFRTPQVFAPLQEARVAAERLGLRLQSLEVGGPNPDWAGAFRAAASQGAGALLTLPGPVVELHRKQVVDLAAEESSSGDLSDERVCGGRRSDVVRARPRRPQAARRDLCGQAPQGCEAGRASRRAADHIRGGRQSQDRERAGADNSAVRAAASRPHP